MGFYEACSKKCLVGLTNFFMNMFQLRKNIYVCYNINLFIAMQL